MRIFGFVFTFVFIKSMPGERVKQIHVTTPGMYQAVPLSEYCIKPSYQQTIQFEVKGFSDAIIDLVTTAGMDSDFYEIVIGGNANKACMIRRNIASTIGDKAYLYIDNIQSGQDYRQFWISWIGGYIKAGHGQVPHLVSTLFIEWHDTNPLSVTSIYLKSSDTVEYIIHDTKRKARFTKLPGKYIGSEILTTSAVESATECAMRCDEHKNCNCFNFKSSNEMCELVQGRKLDMQENTEYNLYSEC